MAQVSKRASACQRCQQDGEILARLRTRAHATSVPYTQHAELHNYSDKMSDGEDAVTLIAWTYEGAEADADHEKNVQRCAPGTVLIHDCFGTCTLLADLDVSAGMLKVRVHEDNSEKEATSGHLRAAPVEFVAPTDDAANNKPAPNPGNVNENKNPGPDGSQNGAKEDSESKPEDSPQPNQPDPAVPEDEPKPSNDDDKPPGHNRDHSDKPPIFEQVLEAAAVQLKQFNLMQENVELVFFKSLVLMDAPGILKSDGEQPLVQVGQAVRERSTGHFMTICKIYKPLLGFVADSKDGVSVDSGGEKHTLDVAKGSRMLGGNSGNYPGDRDCLTIGVKHAKWGLLWLATSKPEATLELFPPADDAAKALGIDESKLQEFGDEAIAEWQTAYRMLLTEEDFNGGGVGLADNSLKGVVNFYARYKRASAKPYQTDAEVEVQKKSKPAPKPRASTRKRTISVLSDDDDDDEGSNAGDENAELGGGARPRRGTRPRQTPKLPSPKAPKAQPRRPTNAAATRPRVSKDDAKVLDKENVPLDTNSPISRLSALTPVRDNPPTSCVPTGVQRNTENVGVNAGAAVEGQRTAPALHPEAENTAATLPTQQQNIAANPPTAMASVNVQPGHQQSNNGKQIMAQQQSMMAAQQHGFPQQGPPFSYSNVPHSSAPPCLQYAHGQHPYMYGTQFQQAPPPPGFPAQPGQSMYHLPPMQQQMLPSCWPSPFGYFFNPQTGTYYPMMAPTPQPQQPAPAPAEKVSPSLAAIEARIYYKSKKEKDLLDAQVLHEYYVSKGLEK